MLRQRGLVSQSIGCEGLHSAFLALVILLNADARGILSGHSTSVAT